MKITTNSEQETFDFAKNYAKKLRGGEVIGLVGELGAGKTVFAKGLAAGLGIKDTITSPTFVIMKIYEIRNSKFKIKNLLHIDTYRIHDNQDLKAIGVEEYFSRPDTVIVIEWAQKVKKILPKKTKYINLSHSGNKRIINY